MTASMLILLVGLGIVVGLLGIVVPVLPGLLLVWGSVSAYAATSGAWGDARGWWLLGIATVIYAAGLVVQYLVPGRALKSRGIPWTTTAAGVALGIVGFFVIPVVGAVVGFVLGIYLVELSRLRSSKAAWPSTVHALKAVGLSMLVELSTGLVLLVIWMLALLAGVGR